MNHELARDDCERRALLVARSGQGNRCIGHLADHAPSWDVDLVEVVDDGGPVDAVPTRESVDRHAISVELDQPFDLRPRQPSLHRV